MDEVQGELLEADGFDRDMEGQSRTTQAHNSCVASLLKATVKEGPHPPLVERISGVKVPCSTWRILCSYALLFSLSCLAPSSMLVLRRENHSPPQCSWSQLQPQDVFVLGL